MSYHNGWFLNTIKIIALVIISVTILVGVVAGLQWLSSRETRCEFCGAGVTKIRLTTLRHTHLRLCGECGEKVVDMMRQGED